MAGVKTTREGQASARNPAVRADGRHRRRIGAVRAPRPPGGAGRRAFRAEGLPRHDRARDRGRGRDPVRQPVPPLRLQGVDRRRDPVELHQRGARRLPRRRRLRRRARAPRSSRSCARPAAPSSGTGPPSRCCRTTGATSPPSPGSPTCPRPCARSSGSGSPSWRLGQESGLFRADLDAQAHLPAAAGRAVDPRAVAPDPRLQHRSGGGRVPRGSCSTGSQTGLDPPFSGAGRRSRPCPSGQARSPRPPASRIHALGRIRGPACLPAAWRLIRDLPGPLGDRGEVAGLDQLVGLEMGEGT